MTERRHAPRQKSLLRGRIYYNGRRSSADCLIRDITESGAHLKFSDTVTVPEVFELHIPNKEESFRARVIWHRGADIGVEFGDMPHLDSPRLAPNGASIEDRVAKLERELAALKRRMDTMQD